MTDQVKQVEITLEDIHSNLYIFAKDVVTEHRTGVSKTGSVEAQAGSPASKFNARFHYQGANLRQVMDHCDYQLGVNLRASLRGTGKKPAWIPPTNSPVDVFVTDGGKVQIRNLPPDVQAQMLFSGIDDLDVRRKAIKAFMAAL